MQRAGERLQLAERLAIVGAGQACGRAEAPLTEAPLHRWRQRADIGRVGGGEIAVFGHIERLKGNQRGIRSGLLSGHGGDQRLHRVGVEIHAFGETARPLEAGDAVGDIDHLVRHGLHEHEVDVRDLVIASIDRLSRAHGRGDMAMDMKTKLVRLRRRGGEPGGIEGAVELHPDHALRLGLANESDGLVLRGGDIGDLGGVRPLPINQGRGIDVRRQQIALRPPLRPRHRQRIVIAWIPDRGHPKRQQHRPGGVIAHVHVAVPQARRQGLTLAVDDLRALGHRGGGRRANGADHALVHDHRLVLSEALAVDEGADVSEGDGSLRRLKQRLDKRRTTGRQTVILRLVQRREAIDRIRRQHAHALNGGEELAVRRGPHWRGRIGQTVDRPADDRALRRSLPDLELRQFLNSGLAAGQQVDRVARRGD